MSSGYNIINNYLARGAVETLDDLKAFDISNLRGSESAVSAGGDVAGDFDGGTYVWVPTSTLDPNDPTLTPGDVVLPNQLTLANPGRWVRAQHAELDQAKTNAYFLQLITPYETSLPAAAAASAQVVIDQGLLEQEALRDETQGLVDEAYGLSGQTVRSTWADLAAVTGTSNAVGLVISSDTGTHTDPVVGGTVPNSGMFAWSTSPVGWKRVGNLDAADSNAAKAAAEAAALLSQKWADSIGQNPGGPGTKSSKEWATASQDSATQAAFYAAQLGAPPAVAPAQPAAYFGEANARNQGTPKAIVLPTGALQWPNPGTDFYLHIGVRLGLFMNDTSQEETIGSKGNPRASGGSDYGVWILEKGVSPGAWTLGWAFKRVSTTWMTNPSSDPLQALKADPGKDYVFIMAQVGNKPYVAWGPTDGSAWRKFTGDANHTAPGFFAAGSAVTATSMVRTSNVVTVTRNAHGLLVGDQVMVDAAGGLVQVATVPTANTWTYALVGADGSLTPTTYRTNTGASLGDILPQLGASQTPTSGPDYRGFAGAVHNIGYYVGTTNVPGSLSGNLVSGGQLSNAFLNNVALGRSTLPGTKRYAHSLGNLSLPASGSFGTTAPTALNGSTDITTAVLQPDYMRVDPRPADWIFAREAFKDTGLVEWDGYSSATVRSVRYTAYSDEARTNVVWESMVAAYPRAINSGRFTVQANNHPCGVSFYGRLTNNDNPNLYADVGPYAVDTVVGMISQSTLRVIGDVSNAGGNVAPVSTSVGFTSVLNMKLGDATDHPANSSAWGRAQFRKVTAAGQEGDGYVAMGNKYVSLRSAALGRPCALGIADFCTSGHPLDAYIHDRKTRRNSVGTITSGGSLSGRWQPVPSPFFTPPAPNAWYPYSETGTVKLYIGGNFVGYADNSGNWQGSGVSGTFDVNTGNYTLTSAIAGLVEIEARLQWNTPEGSALTRRNYGYDYTVFGDETSTGHTGHVIERIRGARRCTYVILAWENFHVSRIQELPNDAARAAHFKYLYDTLRARCLQFTAFQKPDGSEIPWFFAGDPRTSGFSDNGNEQDCRRWSREYAKATPNTWWLIGDYAATMDVAPQSPHAGNLPTGGRSIGENFAHALADWDGIPGASAEEIMPVAVNRVDASTVDIFFSPSVKFPSATLVSGLGGEPHGISFNTTAIGYSSVGLLDTNTHTITIISPYVVRVRRDSGTIPSGYWNVNASNFNSGLAGSTLATQSAYIDDCLFLNTGGYTARPGPCVQHAPVPIYCA